MMASYTLAFTLLTAGGALMVVPAALTPMSDEDWDLLVGLCAVIGAVLALFLIFAMVA